jgi:hypothetical protein
MAEHIHPANSTQRWIGCPGCDAEAVDDLNTVADTFAVVRLRQPTTVPHDLEADLAARWRPSRTQIKEANAALKKGAPEGQVYTLHLLVNKRPSWWTGQEQVRPVEGKVYLRHDDALEAAELAENAIAVAFPGIPVCAGWTAHNPNGTWQVYEL